MINNVNLLERKKFLIQFKISSLESFIKNQSEKTTNGEIWKRVQPINS